MTTITERLNAAWEQSRADFVITPQEIADTVKNNLAEIACSPFEAIEAARGILEAAKLRCVSCGGSTPPAPKAAKGVSARTGLTTVSKSTPEQVVAHKQFQAARRLLETVTQHADQASKTMLDTLYQIEDIVDSKRVSRTGAERVLILLQGLPEELKTSLANTIVGKDRLLENLLPAQGEQDRGLATFFAKYTSAL